LIGNALAEKCREGARCWAEVFSIWLLLAEGHLSRRLFGGMLRMIAALPLPDR
jgi:hypothetical protein